MDSKPEATVEQTEEKVVETEQTVEQTEEKVVETEQTEGNSTILKQEKKEGDDTDNQEDSQPEPIDYSELKFPEGVDVDEVVFSEFKELAQSMNDGKGISSSDAQKLIDLRAKMVEDGIEQWNKTFSEWRGEVLSDENIGGDKLHSQTIPNVMAAAEAYGGSEFRNMLENERIYGDNPHLIRFLNNVGETLREDIHSRGKPAGNSSQDDRMKILYPSHFNQ